jgi:predicted enzyme related to lactoylglutathione lyase
MGHTAIWFDIAASDLDRALSFYEGVLACEIDREKFPG